MNKHFAASIALISSALLCNVAEAQSESAFMAPLVKESMLLDVAKANQLVVVGERGHILSGTPQSLTQVSVPTQVTLTAVDGINDIYIAVGHDATILRSSDGGKTWTEVFSKVEIDRPFLDVMFLSENEALAIGGYGLYYRSTDAGETWELEQDNTSLLSQDDVDYLESIADDPEFYQEELNYIFPHFNRLSKSNGNLFLVGEAGLIARSTDNGRSWERFEIDYYGSFFDVQEIADNQLLAVGLRGNMYLKDGFDEWERIETCITTSLNTIVKTELGFYVVGNNGVVLSLDPARLGQDETQAPNNEGCERHIALTRIPSDISSSISNAFVANGELTAVSANGLQPVE
uniref:sialidase n=1 Tax=Ningiella ruwaisensis TaxID=2364274 RepID=UPI003BA873DB